MRWVGKAREWRAPEFGGCLGAWPTQRKAGLPRRAAPSSLTLPSERIYTQDEMPGHIGQFNDQRELILTPSLRKMMVCGTILCRAVIAKKKRIQTPTAPERFRCLEAAFPNRLGPRTRRKGEIRCFCRREPIYPISSCVIHLPFWK